MWNDFGILLSIVHSELNGWMGSIK